MTEPVEGVVRAEEPMSGIAELRRIDAVAPWWFAASLIATSVAVAALVMSGWRPSQLPQWGEFVWWSSAIVTALGLAGIGYAGCPIYWGSVTIARRQKSAAVRAGLVMFLTGSFVAVMTVLAH